MESLAYSLKSQSDITFAVPIFQVLVVTMIICWDYPLLLLYWLTVRALGVEASRVDASAKPLPVLVVIPSLLRQRDELTSMMSTVTCVATNGYPGKLTLVLTIDGTHDAPLLYEELRQWAKAQTFPANCRLFVTGTANRRSKPMAIDHAMQFVKRLVAQQILDAFPPVYVSTDADADLGEHALERIVYRLQRRNRITGWPARVVAGALHVRGNSFWCGWRHAFTIAGQLNLQVAREYYMSNVWRYNIRWLPITGVPGAFYCTWSEIFLAIPSYFGYTRTLTRRDWFRWWLGYEPPKFSESNAHPIPELIAGDTDDTVTAYMATFARYENGHFSFDSPKTPLHAFYYMLRGVFVDRALQYEPLARVFTSSPTTIKSLFRQRKRWNSSRIELTGRFWTAIGYQWVLSLPVMFVKLFIARNVLMGAFIYIVVPLFLWRGHMWTGVIIGYLCNVICWTTLTFCTLLMNNELRYWRMLLAIPLAPLYVFCFNWIPGAIGATCDVLLFGNVTGFAPESTLIRGGSQRIALLFRLRRAFSLAIRSVVCGDVELGWWWLGWREHHCAPSGFEGFTTKKKRSIIPPPSDWFRNPPPSNNVTETAPRE